jgi:hypothetical protein
MSAGRVGVRERSCMCTTMEGGLHSRTMLQYLYMHMNFWKGDFVLRIMDHGKEKTGLRKSQMNRSIACRTLLFNSISING